MFGMLQFQRTGAGASIGIGSTVVSGTNKSILFIAAGVVAQDNPDFTYDSATDTMNVPIISLEDGAVATPSLYWGTDMGFYRSGVTLRFARDGIERIRIGTDGRIAIGANSTGEMTANGLFHATYESDSNDQDGIIVVDTYGNEGYCTSIGGRTAKGTATVPLAVTTDHKLVEFMAKGHNGTNHNASNRGYIGFYAAEDHSVGNEGVYSVIGTTTIGTAANHNSVYISHKGDVAVSKASGGMTGTFSTGFTQGNSAKVLEVRADSTTDDAGLFIHNSNATKGIAAWIDTSASTAFIDSMYDNNAGLLSIRMKSLNATPVVALTLDSLGKATVYNGLALVNNGILSEVAVVNLTGQTAAIGATNAYTAAETGYYQVCFSASVTTAATSSSTLGHFQVQYTSPTDSVAKSTPTQNNVTGSAGNTTATCLSGTFTVYAKTGTNINYIMGYASSGATPMAYELHITITKL